MPTIAENFGHKYDSKLKTLAEQMVEVMQLFSINSIYGIGGDFVANLIKGLESQITIKSASNEMHAAFCACGQAEVTGMGCVLVTYTVGSLPCLSAAALAKAERLPLVILSGAPGESEIDRVALHHVSSSGNEWNINYDAALNAFNAIGVKSIRLQGARNPEQPSMAGAQFFNAVKHAYLERQPVFIEVPRDIIYAPTQTLNLPCKKEELHCEHILLSGADDITAHVIEKLQQSKSPLVLVGENIKHNSPLKDRLYYFCKASGIPMVSNWLARGIYADDEIHLGVYNGAFTMPELRKLVEQGVDYILEIETSIIPQDTSRAFLSNTDFIASFANKTVLKGTIERSQGLYQIIKTVSKQSFSFNNNALIESFLASRHNRLLYKDDLDSSKKISLKNLAAVINAVTEKLPYGVIYLPEVGNSLFLSYSLINRATQTGRSWLSNPWYAAMGTSIPYARALGEYLKDNNLNDRVLIICGDGGFNFQHNELVHCLKNNIPLTIIYLRNNIFHLGKLSESEIYQSNANEYDLQSQVKAYGGFYSKPESIADFRKILAARLNSNLSVQIIELIVSDLFDELPEEIQWLNHYIGAKNGNFKSNEIWEKHMRGED
ncbi:thiamine pyrophosphate-dependent enzyme [Pleionea sediminis]|uniref:thiamine pyrophosphate-dependent enzyme n=1 Tax=Pleionea sediminis TaxID=2569479 RepID=UPI001184A884|nr:thiamine pyrophosphate-binding protein [Pleionea sediminis]